MKALFSLIFFVATLAPAMAAEGETLWTTGKIHVVLSVLLTILVLIFIFLFILEIKVSRLEKKIYNP